MSLPPIPNDERAALAAEYAAGLLDGPELAQARALAAEDAAFRREVGAWIGRLAPLLDEVDERTPPDRLWQAIEQRTGARDNVVQLRRKVSAWRGIAAGASALAASLALVMVARPPPAEAPPPVVVKAPPPMVAMLGDEKNKAMLVASWDPANRGLTVAAAERIPDPPGRVQELWMIPADGKPRSLGMMKARKIRMQLPEPMADKLREGVTLAISLEPTEGSPTGLPTGPVIASGKLEQA